MSTVEQAENLVRAISERWGFPDESYMARMEPDVRRVMEKCLLAKDKIIGGLIQK